MSVEAHSTPNEREPLAIESKIARPSAILHGFWCANVAAVIAIYGVYLQPTGGCDGGLCGLLPFIAAFAAIQAWFIVFTLVSILIAIANRLDKALAHQPKAALDPASGRGSPAD